MYLYNVSIIIEESCHSDLFTWLQEQWVSQLPSSTKFLKMLQSPHEGHTYCVHLVVRQEEEIHSFHEKHIQQLQDHITQYHKDKAFLFDSVMQYLER